MNESKFPSETPNNDAKCNLVIFGIGHSGTTILARVIHALGWNAGDADQDYAESVSVQAVNERALHGQFDPQDAARALAALPPRWAIKDPRFVHTLHLWHDVFRPYEPMLIWIVRDMNAIARSYQRGDWVRRRSEGKAPPEHVRSGLTLSQSQALASDCYQRWPWGKLQVSYERLLHAASLVRFPQSPSDSASDAPYA